MGSAQRAEAILRLMAAEASRLGVEVASFEVRSDGRRALGRVAWGQSSPRQRWLLLGTARLLLALAALEGEGEAYELLALEGTARVTFSFRLDWEGQAAALGAGWRHWGPGGHP